MNLRLLACLSAGITAAIAAPDDLHFTQKNAIGGFEEVIVAAPGSKCFLHWDTGADEPAWNPTLQLGSAGEAYFLNDLTDIGVNHEGLLVSVDPAGGHVTLGTDGFGTGTAGRLILEGGTGGGGTAEVLFRTGGADQWVIDNDALYPSFSGDDLGTASNLVGEMFAQGPVNVSQNGDTPTLAEGTEGIILSGFDNVSSHKGTMGISSNGDFWLYSTKSMDFDASWDMRFRLALNQQAYWYDNSSAELMRLEEDRDGLHMSVPIHWGNGDDYIDDEGGLNDRITITVEGTIRTTVLSSGIVAGQTGNPYPMMRNTSTTGTATHTWYGDEDTGLARYGTDSVGLQAGSVDALVVDSAGAVELDNLLTLNEVGSAPTGVANKAIIFAEDNGAGKTRLMVQFGTGAAQQIAIEP